jgi:hypothetical protein
MANLNCVLEINETESRISIKGLKEESFIIEYSGDVDFTPLVSLLTECMDNDANIDLADVDNKGLNEKTKLIIETIVSIIKSYNKCICEIETINPQTT